MNSASLTREHSTLEELSGLKRPPPELPAPQDYSPEALLVLGLLMILFILFLRFMIREALIKSPKLLDCSCPSCKQPMRRRRSNWKCLFISLVMPCIRVYCSSCHESHIRLLKPKGQRKKRRKRRQ